LTTWKINVRMKAVVPESEPGDEGAERSATLFGSGLHDEAALLLSGPMREIAR